MNEYWIVKDNITGKVIAHCGDINDAIMMVSLDSNRSYSRHRFLSDQVIDVTSTVDKQLPGQQGLPAAKYPLPNFEEEVYLPQGTKVPLNTK